MKRCLTFGSVICVFLVISLFPTGVKAQGPSPYLDGQTVIDLLKVQNGVHVEFYNTARGECSARVTSAKPMHELLGLKNPDEVIDAFGLVDHILQSDGTHLYRFIVPPSNCPPPPPGKSSFGEHAWNGAKSFVRGLLPAKWSGPDYEWVVTMGALVMVIAGVGLALGVVTRRSV